ncbi:hypothetical protein [Pseudomonas monteilii]|uniref:hypothetical protein n=1 Tax=Pseudomonas monteilii TaxID=76759 RepID=UPI001E29906D|nr:hypothetical protein [Pseudomonas monteilii]MCE0925989.1 hypothetical protein [Pseudomonas monteilii]MCE0934676.1 hypothetical protein [Pseudomonas monteilii]MCE0980975.1 hypothetical protein [Pseudomonas monteilii]MCE1012258.1 hypothetical protein [Pseudomonas monteilii]MCE1040964.1 hypothetical protein [Pseudomonas monteilii]
MATDREIALEQALVAVLGATQDLNLNLVEISQRAKSLIIDNSKYRQAEHPHVSNAWNEVESAVVKVRKLA